MINKYFRIQYSTHLVLLVCDIRCSEINPPDLNIIHVTSLQNNHEDEIRLFPAALSPRVMY